MKKIIILALVCPLFWWIVFHPRSYINEWLHTPEYISTKITSLSTTDYSAKVDTMRWQSTITHGRYFAHLFYNPLLFAIDEFFGLVSNLSPRIYFLSGDGTNLSPAHAPILSLLVIVWFMGLIELIKTRQTKKLLFLLVLALPAYITGKRNFAFLLPVAIYYLWLAVLGIQTIFRLKDK